MRLDIIGAQNQVSRDDAIGGQRWTIYLLLGQNGGQTVGDGADAADALGDLLGVERIAPFEYVLETTEHFSSAISTGHLAAIKLKTNAQVPFDAGQRRQLNQGAHVASVLCGLNQLLAADGRRFSACVKVLIGASNGESEVGRRS